MPSFDMPVLSFLPKPYKSKSKWKGKSVVKSPFAGRGLHSHSSSSLHPYAAPDVIDINDSHLRELDEGDEVEVGTSSSAAAIPAMPAMPTIPPIPSETPQVKLDIDITPEVPLTDWFTLNFPQSELPTESLPGDPGPSSAQLSSHAFGRYQSNDAARNGSVEDDTSEDADEDPGTSSEDVIRGLQALGPSDFISDSIIDRSLQSQNFWLDMRPPPAPIRIPSAILNSSLRSGDFTSRPQSQVSTPASSAISGTTLARALLANTFVLSNDTRSSRYRSGFSGLARSDSATLPRGEYPLLSPIWRERKQSGGADSLTPGSGDIPLLPAGAELVYVPPKTPRHSGIDPREIRKRRSSTGSLISRPKSSTNLAPTTPTDDGHLSLKRRISKISEVNSAPQTPEMSHRGAQDATEHARNSPTPSPHPLLSSHELLPKADKETDLQKPYPDSQRAAHGSPGAQAESPISSEVPVPVAYVQHGIHGTAEPVSDFASPTLPTNLSDLPILPLDSPVLPSASHSSTKDYVPELPTSPESNSSYPTSPEPNVLSSEQSPVSDKAPSPKDLRDVLDYYSFANASQDPIDRGFRPAFSPITEESSSQLSPPTPYNRRDSIRSPLGARSRSPQSATFIVARKNSDPRSQTKHTLLPIGERPSSVHSTRSSLISPVSRSSSAHSSSAAVFDRLIPPQTSKIFNRQRSGSAPSPIKVVRDSKDFNAYNITVSPLTDGSSTTPPSTGNIDDEATGQTFPETPSAFSPMLSPNSVPSTVSRESSMQYVIAPPMPSGPMSASIPSANIQPSLAQQILLTRAATSVHGARTHSRQMSLTSGRNQQSTSSSVPTASEPAGSLTSVPEGASQLKPSGDSVLPAISPSNEAVPTQVSDQLTDNQTGSAPTSNSAFIPDPVEPLNINRPTSIFQVSESSSAASSISRTSSHVKSPHSGSSAPNSEMRTRGPRSRPPGLQLGSPNTNDHSERPNPLPQSPAVNRRVDPPQSAQVAVYPPPDPAPVPVPMIDYSPHSNLHPGPSATSEDFASLGAPPPYYSIVDVRNPDLSPPSNPIDNGNSNRVVAPQISHTPTTSHSDQTSLGREGPSGNRRPRTRPPQARPAGPRQPSHTSPGIVGRERNTSISSVVSRIHSRNPPSAFSPKFQPPPTKWRGCTMEAAKWTFTSAQLQDIVSRAIKQSAEASSIRLLRLEIIDSELPRELERLELQRTDVKTRYKVLTRRRNHLLEMLSGQLGGTSERADTAFCLGTVEELKDITTSLDMLAEDLHSVSEQIAQLEKLKQVHSASALSMALRKLNASFLKQVAENEVLRKHVDSLEAERDEAWKQAEEVAGDFDRYLSEKLDGSSYEQGKRFSRISASRKSSIRVSKAGLRSNSRRVSQRSSVSSNGQRLSSVTWPSSAKTSLYSDEVPPVPPIPRRRPVDIRTDLPSRSPAGLSTDMGTPTSEMRALAQVQEELYRMLGMTSPDTKLRRSRSVLNLSSPPVSAAMVSSPFGAPPRDPSSLSRRLSLPGSSTFMEAHNAMMADRDAMLATLGMLSQDD